jgi:hypothetical protein
MSNMYKQFAIIVAIALVFFVLVGGYFMFSKPSTTAEFVDTTEVSAPEGVNTVKADQSVSERMKPAYQTRGCAWKWYEVRNVGIWAETCTFDSTKWYLKESAGDALVLVIGDAQARRALQLFQKPRTSGIESIVNQIAESAPKECVMQKNEIQSGPGRLVYEFAPTGALKRAFEKSTEVPADPCGSYGISAMGQRLFEVWEGHEDTVIFLDYGPDGSLFEYDSLTFIR